MLVCVQVACNIEARPPNLFFLIQIQRKPPSLLQKGAFHHLHFARWRGENIFQEVTNPVVETPISSQPGENGLRAEIDVRHHLYLPCLFLHVVLVDANGIDPEPQGSPVRAVSEVPERITQVERDLEDCAVDEDVGRLGRVTPHIGESLILRPLAELDVPDGALDIVGSLGIWAVSRRLECSPPTDPEAGI